MQYPPIILMIAAYNEERDLPGLLARVEYSLSSWAKYRVLIIDDGSSDRTASIASDAADRMPVTLIRHSRNQGMGAAIRTGLRAAAAEEGVLVTLDADNSHDPELIRVMVERLGQGVDVVIASRFQPSSREVGVPFFRVFLSHLASAGMRILARYPGARDYTCGFRAYRLETIRRLINVFGAQAFLRENGFACMLELLLNLRAIGARVAEVPLVLRYDLKTGASKIKIVRTISRYTVTVTRASMPLAWRARRGGLELSSSR